MSDEPPKPVVATGPKPSKLVIALLVFNLGASGFAIFKLMTAQPAAAATLATPAPPPPTSIVGPVHALDPFVVNLDEPGTSRYIKVTMQLELVTADAGPAIEKSKQLIRDTILSHLSGLHLADTLGTAAKDKLRADVMVKLEEIVGKDKIRRLFFQEFVVQ